MNVFVYGQKFNENLLRYSKKKGQKKIYFRKEDLVDYLNGEIMSTTEDLEHAHVAIWKK